MKKHCLILLLAALLTTPLFAGVVYEIEVIDHEQSPPKTESIQAAVEGRNLKMGIASQGKGAQGEMIFRGDRREMVVVDHEKRSFHVMDEATMKQLAGQVNSMMAQMQEALKNVPPELRATVEGAMKRQMPQEQQARAPRSEIEKTSERATHNGYPCVKYVVSRDGRKVRELWVTDWSNLEGGSEVVEAFEGMAEFFREMLDSLPNVGRGGPGFDDNMFEHLKELGGFPVVTREFADDGALEGETTLRSAKRQNLDPDVFEPPAGYKRQEMFSGR